MLLNKAVSGSVVLATDVQKTAADCNRDGVLSAEDGVTAGLFLSYQGELYAAIATYSYQIMIFAVREVSRQNHPLL